MKNYLSAPLFLITFILLWVQSGYSQVNQKFGLECTLNYTLAYGWTIDKSVTPDTWDLLTGDEGTSEYTITLTKDEGTYGLYFDLKIINKSNDPIFVSKIKATMVRVSAVPGEPDFNVITNEITFGDIDPLVIPVDGSYDYKICATDPNAFPGATYRVDVDVTNAGDGTEERQCTELLQKKDEPVILNDEVTVIDGDNEWPFTDDGEVSYDRTFSCNDDEGENKNTATIEYLDPCNEPVEKSASATVTVNCYELEVSKDVSTSLDRTYTWDIEKSADKSALTLATGQTYLVNYTVKVVRDDGTDNNWAAEGTISVHNPAPIDAVINSVSDIVSPDIEATVDCGGVVFPYTLTAGGDFSCSYTVSLPDANERLNTATATLQNYSYDKDLDATANGTTNFSGSASVDFSEADVNEIDECADVSDDQQGDLGTVCDDQTFEYSFTIPGYEVCGMYTFTNTATFTTNDTGTEGSSSWDIEIDVPCDGCTLTQGYWKTHSSKGPAPYDSDWKKLGDVDGDGVSEGEGEVFFRSKNGVTGKTYYQVLLTSPSGNVYFLLAHQYIAAKLNILNGADPAAAAAAITWAENFFNTYKPTSSLSKSLKTMATAYAKILDDYNNGIIGPGHCSEEAMPLTFNSAENEGSELLVLPTELKVTASPVPFNDEVRFTVAIPYDCEMSLELYNANGQNFYSLPKTRCFANQTLTVKVDGSRMSEGVYFYRLKTDSETKVGQLMKISSK